MSGVFVEYLTTIIYLYNTIISSEIKPLIGDRNIKCSIRNIYHYVDAPSNV